MFTLTEWKHPDNFQNALKLKSHWNKLKSSLRYYGYNLTDYFSSVEYKPLYNPDPKYTDAENVLRYPHMHALVPSYIDLELARRLWYKATNCTADQVHIPEDLDPALKNPVAYLTKYMTKSDMQAGFHKGERRFIFSRNYKPYQVEYKYQKKGEIHTFIPFVSNGGGIVIPRRLKAPKEDWLKVEQFYKTKIEEWYDKFPEQAEQLRKEEEFYYLEQEQRRENYDVLDDYLIETEFQGDFVVDRSDPRKKDNPAHVYANVKMGTFLSALSKKGKIDNDLKSNDK